MKPLDECVSVAKLGHMGYMQLGDHVPPVQFAISASSTVISASSTVINCELDAKKHAFIMLQSWVEIEHYSVVYFDCSVTFKVL